jgi:hypothetical protein
VQGRQFQLPKAQNTFRLCAASAGHFLASAANTASDLAIALTSAAIIRITSSHPWHRGYRILLLPHPIAVSVRIISLGECAIYGSNRTVEPPRKAARRGNRRGKTVRESKSPPYVGTSHRLFPECSPLGGVSEIDVIACDCFYGRTLASATWNFHLHWLCRRWNLLAGKTAEITGIYAEFQDPIE